MYWLDRTKSFCHLSAEVLAIAQSNSEKYEIVENFFLSISTFLLTTGNILQHTCNDEFSQEKIVKLV